ncbi:cytochrome c [Breoghania sp.]|uniref:c-type cytochrome n=1 Tax=Breoghania sp. TaxID=2065378 RepID=UPI00262E5DFA|nr:cytochrome c [Breoghania sp.]MDJ0932756.1 cytochrome c [Breoghania sp.]
MAAADLFNQNCASCHGENGAGGMRIGNATSADLRAPGLENMYHGNDKALAGAILNGINEDGDKLSPVMPLFQGSLTSDQVSNLIDYLKSLHS